MFRHSPARDGLLDHGRQPRAADYSRHMPGSKSLLVRMGRKNRSFYIETQMLSPRETTFGKLSQARAYAKHVKFQPVNRGPNGVQSLENCPLGSNWGPNLRRASLVLS